MSKKFQLSGYAKIILLFAGVCVGLFLPGCSDDDANDLLPNVTLSVNDLDFGNVAINGLVVETVTIKNITNSPIIVARVTSTNTTFEFGGYFSNNQMIDLVVPFTIEANGSSTLYIGFRPQQAMTYIGKIVIESTEEDGTDAETDLLDLQGVGIE